MNKIPKWHIVFFALFSFGLIGLNLLPAILKAASSDVQRFTIQDKEVYRLDKDGAVFIASGIWSFNGLFVEKVDYDDLPKSSDSAVIGPVAFVISTGAMFGNSTINQGTTFYSLSTGAANIIQPVVPRTLRFKIDFGTGYAVVIGTDNFGNRVTETIAISSDKLPGI